MRIRNRLTALLMAVLMLTSAVIPTSAFAIENDKAPNVGMTVKIELKKPNGTGLPGGEVIDWGDGYYIVASQDGNNVCYAPVIKSEGHEAHKISIQQFTDADGQITGLDPQNDYQIKLVKYTGTEPFSLTSTFEETTSLGLYTLGAFEKRGNSYDATARQKELHYYVRLQFDTTNTAEINLNSGRVDTEEENGFTIVAIQQPEYKRQTTPVTNALYNNETYRNVDNKNGVTYIDIPVTWLNHQNQPEEFKPDKKVEVKFIVDGNWGATLDVAEGEYINAFKIVSYPNPNDITNRIIDPETGNVYDVVTLQKNTDQFTNYSLDYLLKGYNVITLSKKSSTQHSANLTNAETHATSAATWSDGDFCSLNHTIGAILVRNNWIDGGPAADSVADDTRLKKPSAVGGYVPTQDGYNNARVHGRGVGSAKFDFYVGEENNVVGRKVNSNGAVNDGYTNYQVGTTIVNEHYVDWNALQGAVSSTSRAMLAEGYKNAENNPVVPYYAQYDGSTVRVIDVQFGDKVTWDFNADENVVINIITDLSPEEQNKAAAVVISNGGGGENNTYIQPRIAINGVLQTETVEEGDGISVAFNFPNAKHVRLPNRVNLGHVIAPKAALVVEGGNYSGCLIADSVCSNGEGHLYPYNGSKIIGFDAKIKVSKKVNDANPSVNQKYNFILEKLQDTIEISQENSDFWERIDRVQNNRENVNFEHIQIAEEGDLYFRIYEESASKPRTTIDNKQYLIKVHVTRTVDGRNVIFSIDHDNITYYEIKNKDNLLTVTVDSENELKHAVINQDAIGPAKDISWESNDEPIEPGITFYNTEEDSSTSVTFTGKKTLEGRDQVEGEFTYTVRDSAGNPVAYGRSHKTNGGNGTIEFTSIKYSSSLFENTTENSLTFEYTVTEDMPPEAVAPDYIGNNGVKYDPTKKTVTVVVSINRSDDTMTAAVQEELPEGLSFTNTYSAEGEAQVEATKVFTGRGWTDEDSFEFTLAADASNPEGATLPTTMKLNATKAQQTVTFDKIKFTKPGTYKFTITETVPAGAVDGVLNGQGKYENADGEIYEGSFVDGKAEGKGKITWTDGSVFEGSFVGGQKEGYGVFTDSEGNTCSGDYKDGFFTGKGKMRQPGGDLYEGTFINGVFTGKGKITMSDGTVYEGDFLYGSLTGKGRITMKDGAVYEGELSDGIYTGQGKLISPSGAVYEGSFSKGKKNGKGVMTWPNGETYEGDFADDRRSGRGKYTWSDGGVYEGDFLEDKRTGWGVYRWLGGAVYEGQFVDGKIKGKGIKKWPDGTVYEGDFENGVMHGRGKYTWTTGNVYEGDFENGVMHGRGRYTWPSGDVYEGDFRKGKFSGRGQLIKSDGNSFKGRFKDGRPVM